MAHFRCWREAIFCQLDGGQSRVSWIARSLTTVVERELFNSLDLPLNLQDNSHNRFHRQLTGVRAAAEARARALPVLGV